MIDFSRVSYIITRYGYMIGYGILSTLILAVVGTVVGLILGIFLAYGKNIKIKELDNPVIKGLKYFVKGVCNIYSIIFRGTPMMVQALVFQYGCQALGFNWTYVQFPSPLSNFLSGWILAGLIVIILNTAAYMGEIVKSGLNGVDKGQEEGARSLGMSASRTSFSIILPQALKNALPTIGNELIVNIKDSSVLNVIGATELYYRLYITIGGRTFAYLEALLILSIVYLILTLFATFCLKLIEKKLNGVKFSFNPFRSARRKVEEL